MKYMMVSYFNSNNYGDILLSKSLYDNVVKFVQVKTCSFEGAFGRPNKFAYKYKYISRVRNKLESKMFWTRFENKLKKCDGLIIGGGNMVMSISTYSTIELFKKYILLALKYKKKVFVPFIGVGPINTEEVIEIRDIFSKCDYISFRDKSSYKYFANNASIDNISYDPALLCGHYKNIKKKYTTINVINPDLFVKDEFDKYLDFYIHLINKIKEQEENPNICITISELNDYKMLNEIKKRINDINVKYVVPRTIGDMLKVICSSKMVFGTRMHFLIVSYTQYVPIIGFEWQEKVKSFFVNVNMEKNCFLPTLENMELILERKKEIIERYDEYMDNNKINLDKIQKNIKEQLQIIKEKIYET